MKEDETYWAIFAELSGILSIGCFLAFAFTTFAGSMTRA